MILCLRQKGLPLDDLVDLVQQPLPEATRSSVYRLLKRNGVGRLPKKGEQETGQEDKHGQFKDYGPGFLHIDCFYLPKLEGKKRYCFVAIDRATRLSFLWVYEHKDKQAATAFLKQCLAFFPFQVSKILTDNGREFTLKGFKNRYGTKVKAVHDFEQVCQQQEIEHRTTLPYTPKTNGMVERMNGLTKENTTKKRRYETVAAMLSDLHGWFVRYNFCRKNRRMGARPPMKPSYSGVPSSQGYLSRSRPRFWLFVHNLLTLDMKQIMNERFMVVKMTDRYEQGLDGGQSVFDRLTRFVKNIFKTNLEIFFEAFEY